MPRTKDTAPANAKPKAKPKATLPATRLRSRRRPHLRVVGENIATTRHAFTLDMDNSHVGDWVVEVWSFAEWSAVAPELRPTPPLHMIPGLGFAKFSRPNSKAELDDVNDIAKQAWQRYRDAVE